jgi:nickel/cobalt exporter
VSATPGLLAAAAGVGFGHAVLPDHWVPLAVVGRTQRYSVGRVARLAGLAAVAHVLLSLILGGVIVAIGLQFRSTVESAQNVIVGCLLVGTGIAFAVFEAIGGGHRHHDDHAHHHHQHHPSPSRLQSLAGVMVPFGAAASPDLTILPVFLAATTGGVGVAIGSLIVFAAVTIGTIVGLTLFATIGGHQIRAPWLDRWGNLFTALVLVVIGALILAGVL